MRIMHVLFVDDDQDDHFLMEEVLKEIVVQTKLSSAFNGLEALNFLSNGQVVPDIIILDVNMPVMDGITTLEKIRANKAYQHVPVIIFTTSQNQQTVSDAYKRGASLYLCKPNQYSDYVVLLESLLTAEDISNIDLIVRDSKT